MGGDALPLGEFAPRQQLRVPAHEIDRPRFPVIDAHNHLGDAFGGAWQGRSAAELAASLDEAGVDAIVDLDGGWGDALRREIERWQIPLPGRVAVFAGLDYDAWATTRDFGELEARRLREGVAAGARGLKVWKRLGLWARDPAGRLVPVDDARLDPLWAAAAELRVPVVIHVADPIAFFEPLDRFNERREELLEHPDWHVWPTRPPGAGPGHPLPARFDEIIDQLESLAVRHPATTFVGAHVGCAAEDLARVGAVLDRCPNFHVDIAARIAELGRQPYTAREFMLRYAGRVLFGTDEPPDLAAYRTHYRFLETSDESFPYDADAPVPPQGRWTVCGLGLPDDVLRKVYAENARRVLRLG